MLDDPKLAEATVANGDADLIAVARGMLRDPYWALHAIQAVAGTAKPPRQYERAY
jgi:2,4-dienoyl-CoA reductase-like NADH-dependent reductase (Old Yellow Enzyme family)